MIFVVGSDQSSLNILRVLNYNCRPEKELLECVLTICTRHTKKLVSASNLVELADYLDNIKNKNLFCWFYILYNVFDVISNEYDIKFICHKDHIDSAKLAKEYYEKLIIGH